MKGLSDSGFLDLKLFNFFKKNDKDLQKLKWRSPI